MTARVTDIASRLSLRVSIIAGLVFAIPFVTFVSALVVFPMLFYFALALVANIGLPVVATLYMARRDSFPGETPSPLFMFWRNCSIMWVGCAFGMAHWGDVASTMGASNIPYWKVLFAPYLWLLGVPIS